jgi:aryl-alcohol dehydrogenase-like predicted oxidoreductase
LRRGAATRRRAAYNQLGRTGLFVSEICLGAMTFGGDARGIWSMIGEVDQKDATP